MAKKPIETCHLGNIRTKHQRIMLDEYSYIHEHLETLYFIVKEFDCRNILEIGTGAGYSTLAMAEATKGIVTTIDINECGQAQDMIIFDNGLGHKVNFIQGDSVKSFPKGFYDLILIDGDHSAEKVRKELEALIPYLRENGFLILHDSCNPKWGKGILEAVREFYRNRQNEMTWYEWFNCNGLIVLKNKLE